MAGTVVAAASAMPQTRGSAPLPFAMMRNTQSPFAIDKKVMQELQNKIHVFCKETGTHMPLLLILITDNDLKDGMHGVFPQCVTVFFA
ncbi:MAG: hypothetical protein K6G44_04325 [Lentisphaeria bacterium]|nr:hypothetical protein [Lentisphaeria bacterium]